MILGVADTNILIELYRNRPAAKTWVAIQNDLAIASVTWMEFMEGARGKAGQSVCRQIVAPFDIAFLTKADQTWAMNQLLKYRLSHGVSLKDCLIASVCHRLKVPIYTQNVKDFVPLLGKKLVIKPY